MKQWGTAVVLLWGLAASGGAWAGDDPKAKPAYDKANAILYDATQEHTLKEIAQACELLEDSVAIQERAASLHALGVCYDRLGQIASAYAAFSRTANYVLSKSELADLPDKRKKKRKADHASLVESAGQYLKAHKPSQLKIVLGNDAKYVAGLTVQIQRQQVDELWEVDTSPRAVVTGQLDNFDGGQYLVTATAEGYLPWTQLITIDRENGTHKLVVELLQHEPKVEPKVDPVVEEPAHDEPVKEELVEPEPQPDPPGPIIIHDRSPNALTGQRKLGLAVGILGVGLGVAGAIFEFKARDLYDEYNTPPYDPSDLDAANSKRDVAIGLAITGGVAVAAAVVLWITGGPDDPPSDRTSLVPVLGDDEAGFAAFGRF